MYSQQSLFGILFILQLVILFFISRQTINEIFRFLRRFTRSDNIVFSIVSFIFLPGTILHEMSHFVMATLLFLKVREVHIFPEWKDNYIKLGRVVYEKQDVIRSIFVGIAPIIIGLLFLWWMSVIDALYIEEIGIKILVLYIIFIISSTMFSSKQDLIDIVYIIPFFILLGGLFYIFQIDLRWILENKVVVEATAKFLYDVNIYLAISLGIHAFLFTVLRILRYSSLR